MADELIARLRAACSREGKPSGAHMIDSQRQIARHMAARMDDEEAQCIAQVADCMAHCIENEALLFECLKTEALAAADYLEPLANIPDPAAFVAAFEGVVEALGGLLVFAEAAETKALIGDEGCLWPCEEARSALTAARSARPTPPEPPVTREKKGGAE